MQSAVLKHAGMSCLMIGALLGSTQATANTVTYQAITDFPVIDAGEVPYYVDQGRQALAINAALEEYRGLFARAEVVFDGQPGAYQITLVGLAELDGEAEYHLLVNGEIVGTATNPEVVQDFTVVRHEFSDIDLPAGALIGVESVANSNGKIPENDEYAFARGRWTMLELSDADESTVNETIDLTLNASISRQAIEVGESFDIAVSVTNGIDSAVATGVEVSMQLPVESLELVESSVCTGTPTGFQCSLPELAAAQSTQVTVRLRPIAELSSTPISMSVSADQTDSNQSDNASELLITASSNEGVGRTEGTPDSNTEATDSGTDEEPMNVQTDTAQTVSAPDASKSSGALSIASLFMFFMCGVYCRKGL